MRITEIRCYPLFIKDAQGNVLDRGENNHTLIELITDQGLKGYGTTYTTWALAQAAMRLLEPMLLSEQQVEPARIAERLHQQNFWMGRGGSVTHVISGVDIAMWDLMGKKLGISVSRLIGGRYRDKIRPYASVTFTDGRPMEPKIEAAIEKGYMGLKMGWGTLGRLDLKNDERVVAACRKALGDDRALMIDAGGSGLYYNVTYKRALETAKMMRDYDVEWYEEALRPDDIEGFVRLRENAPVRIASGEVFTRRQSFMPWIDRGALDIVQPDTTKCGGLTEALRIAWYAYDHGIDYVGHGWNTALGLCTDLQLAAAMPNAAWVEYYTPTPLIDDLVTRPFVMEDGFLQIPDAPGLGVEPDMERVAYYAAR